MTLANAKDYIARIIGGQGNSVVEGYAGDSLAVAMEDFSNRHNWAFLLQDTGSGFTVGGCVTNNTSTLTTVTADGFKDVLAGMTLAGTDIPANTTVQTVNTTTALTMTAPATGATSALTMTFGGGIPVVAGTDTYALPTRFHKPYTCRLQVQKRNLVYIQQNQVDRILYDLTVESTPTHYTIYDSEDFDASGLQQSKIKLIRPPGEDDTALLRYYRPMDATKDPVDVHDRYLYVVLDYARALLLRERNATDQRLPLLLQEADRRVQRAIADDKLEGGIDQNERFLSPMETSRTGSLEQWPRGDHPPYGGF